MFRYHRILYRRLLRGQTTDDLLRLREESGQFPTLAQLIEDELGRRQNEAQGQSENSGRAFGGAVAAFPAA